jgi:hypothetical protein
MESVSLKYLNEAYKNRLKTLHNEVFNDKIANSLDIFIEYLKYTRDYFIIADFGQNSDKLATIATAIAEFEAIKSTKDPAKKEFHWSNFWEFVKVNCKEWLDINDSV